MRPTRWTVLLAIGVLAGIVSWLVVSREYDSWPALPIAGPLTLVILAVAELLFAFSVRNRLRNAFQPVRHRLDPIFVARLAVLAKASSHAAAVVGGLYAGFLVYTLRHLGKPRINSDSRASAISLAASVALLAAALFLEHCCRVPKPPDAERRPR
jgi:hypothetical protein